VAAAKVTACVVPTDELGVENQTYSHVGGLTSTRFTFAGTWACDRVVWRRQCHLSIALCKVASLGFAAHSRGMAGRRLTTVMLDGAHPVLVGDAVCKDRTRERGWLESMSRLCQSEDSMVGR
jgi:hypothetical protein